jgi:hypothetical protein
MRESTPQILKNTKGEACGILLEASYCAEQEWGVKKLNQLLGVTDLSPEEMGRDYQGPWGLEMRRITQAAPDQTYWKQKPKLKKNNGPIWTLAVERGINVGAGALGEIPYWDKLPKPYKGDTQPLKKMAAWDGEAFLCTTNDPEMGAILTELHTALKNPEETAIALWLGGAGNNPFARNGLCLGLLDKIDPENLQMAEDADKGRLELHWVAHDTGIPSLIPKEKYYALAPGRRLKSRIKPGANDEDRKIPDVIETDYAVMFFLNPKDQRNNNCGWFTVEELRAWQEGKPSPIPKVEKAA